MRLTIYPVATIQGELRPPSDKSLTHRAYLLGAIASEPSVVRTPLRGEDCEATLRCLARMGLGVRHDGEATILTPVETWRTAQSDLDCGNSGTTARLLAGLVASRPITARFIGDASLSRRPMRRIVEPLHAMGAQIEGETLPLTIRGGALTGIAWTSPVASAQVKSAILLAGLRAAGESRVTEPSLSRDHTERMLAALGVDVTVDGLTVAVNGGGKPPTGFDFAVPADISSAAFFLAAACLLPSSDLVLRDIGLNPGRTGILDVLTAAGVPFEKELRAARLREPVGDLSIRTPRVLRSFTVEGDLVPRLIDEIPILAILATQCDGISVFRDCGELRVKESDRIARVAEGLRRMGATIETREDGMTITGPTRLRGATIEASGDHRIAMAFAIAGLVAEGETVIEGAEAIATSFPDFEKELMRLCVI